MPRVLRNLKISEVSGVDRGAGRGVKIMLMKRDFSAKERRTAAGSGAAMPDGSFPIKSVSDLHNAIKLAGNAKDPAKAKAHIKARAKALGASDQIPDTWKRDDSEVDGDIALDALMARIAEIMADPSCDLSKLDETFADFKKHVTQESEMTNEEISALVAKSVTDALAASTAAAATELAKRDLQIAILKMSDKAKAHYNSLDSDDAKKAFASKDPKAQDDECDSKTAKKRDAEELPEIAKRLVSAEEQNVALQKQLTELLTDKSVGVFKQKAIDAGLTEADGEIMRKAFGGDTDAQVALAKRMAEVTAGLKKQVQAGKLFGEFGSGAGGGEGGALTAYDELQKLAGDLRKVDPKLSPQQAFTKVYTDPANRELALREKKEQADTLAKRAAGYGA